MCCVDCVCLAEYVSCCDCLDLTKMGDLDVRDNDFAFIWIDAGMTGIECRYVDAASLMLYVLFLALLMTTLRVEDSR